MAVEGSDTLVFAGRNGAQNGVARRAGLSRPALKVIGTGGRTAVEGGRLTVTGADAVVLLIAAATSYRSFRDVSRRSGGQEPAGSSPAPRRRAGTPC